MKFVNVAKRFLGHLLPSLPRSTPWLPLCGRRLPSSHCRWSGSKQLLMHEPLSSTNGTRAWWCRFGLLATHHVGIYKIASCPPPPCSAASCPLSSPPPSLRSLPLLNLKPPHQHSRTCSATSCPPSNPPPLPRSPPSTQSQTVALAQPNHSVCSRPVTPPHPHPHLLTHRRASALVKPRHHLPHRPRNGNSGLGKWREGENQNGGREHNTPDFVYRVHHTPYFVRCMIELAVHVHSK